MAANKVVLDGDKIRVLRELRGLSSQADLAHATRAIDAKRSGLADRTVWDAENRRGVTRRTQLLIARALDVRDPDELLSREEFAVVPDDRRPLLPLDCQAPAPTTLPPGERRPGSARVVALASVVTIVVAASASAVLWLRPAPDPSPTTDNGRQLARLDDAIWTVNGSAARAALANMCAPRARVVQPTLSFSPTLGLGMTGIAGTYQQTGIQSVKAFRPPFTVAATVMATTMNAGAFALVITDANGGKGVVLDGSQGANDVFTGLFYQSPNGPGTHWELRGKLSEPRAPSLRVWYRLVVSVDPAGNATVAAGPEGAEPQRGRLPVGTGPFYVVLSQGAGAHDTGPNQAYWRSVTVSNRGLSATLQT